jgi:hypothetical protein
MESDLGFSGSYAAEDVTFLLRRLDLQPVRLEEREQLIQSGNRHYSEMIGPEDAPTRERVRIFRECLGANAGRLAQDLVTLAAMLEATAVDGELTIVSIARAGTPIGVLLTRLLRARMGVEKVRHYSISVIRDRGIDLAAVDFIVARHGVESIRFIDGWTGKGTIANEIAASFAKLPQYRGRIDDGLWVPLDISGAARGAASVDDYIIPSSLLGGTISGLVSRSVLPREDIGARMFHGCLELTTLRRYDLSRWFVDLLEARCLRLKPLPAPDTSARQASFAAAQRFIDGLMAEFGITDRNRVKIGIGETVRVALRRLPERVLLRSEESADAALIARLARLRGVPVEYRPEMPQAAVGLIANVLKAG